MSTTKLDVTEHQSVVCMALEFYAEKMSEVGHDAEIAGLQREAFAFRQAAKAADAARSAFDYENCESIEVSALS